MTQRKRIDVRRSAYADQKKDNLYQHTSSSAGRMKPMKRPAPAHPNLVLKENRDPLLGFTLRVRVRPEPQPSERSRPALGLALPPTLLLGLLPLGLVLLPGEIRARCDGTVGSERHG